jgi:hypothetical protein
MTNHPLTYIHELTCFFRAKFNQHMHESTMFRLIREAGFTNKVVKRIAIQIQLNDVARFTREIYALYERGPTIQESFIFVDEVSTDNRDLNRYRGWFLRGSYPFINEW